MVFLITRILQSKVLFSPSYCHNTLLDSFKLTQIRCYAARKGTRERKKKAKVKVEVKKVGFIPHNQRDKEKELASRPSRRFIDANTKDPVDNVYVAKYFKRKVYSFVEAVECHRETHHPEVYNKPNANLHVSIELNMQGVKATRFVDSFTRIVAIPHKIDHGEERPTIAFSKTPENQKIAENAGAQLSGGIELIKQIQLGMVSLQDFKFFIAHPEILPELIPLRGLMKRRFPNPREGTLVVDLDAAVCRFLNGINYSAVRDEYEKTFGIIETVIGTLDMDSKHLEENFAALINDVHSMKPKREGDFITRCSLTSPPSREIFKVNYNPYLGEEPLEKEMEPEEEVEEETVTL